jgi:hypothetical protein
MRALWIRISPAGSLAWNELHRQTLAFPFPYDWNAGSIPHIFIGNGSTGDASIIFTTTQMEYGICMYPFLLACLWLLNGWALWPLPRFLLMIWRELPFGMTKVGLCSRAWQATLILLLPPTTLFRISLQIGKIAGLLWKAFSQRTRS